MPGQAPAVPAPSPPAAADSSGDEGHQAVQLQGGVREGGEGHQELTVCPRPLAELPAGADPEPRVLAVLQAL